MQTLLAREPGDLAIDRSAIVVGPHREGEELYNLTRVMNIVGIKPLLAAIRA